jgi:hypothetical protein
MPREYFLLLSTFLISPAITAPSHALAAEAPQVISEDGQGPLTIAEAKALVARSLLDIGQRMVQLVTQEGIPFRHVLVDGKTHTLVAAKDRHTLNG